MMKVVVYSTNTYDKTHFEATADHAFTFEYVGTALSIDTVHLAADAFAVCIFVNDDASRPVLEKLAAMGVKGIAIRAAGHDQTDHEAAHQLGLHVAYVPAYSPHSIAEHTVALLLALTRKIVEADKRVKSYNFKLDPLVGFNLHHKKVGIVGIGKIGGITAKILQGFGCTLLGYDPKPNEEYAKAYGLQYVSIDELIQNADIIIIQAPLNAATKHLINTDSIAKMKDGVFIINTGRGAIINTADAIEGLKSGKIGALGIDVYENEKGLFFNDHTMSIPTDDVFARLLTFKNVLVTGHMAFLTTNALTSIVQTTLENLNAWKDGRNAVNEL
ncbi:2-hydroxyacid dehydrogenase [Cytophaga aurantiaca]|uniref:2-hydroxyacid dehydrogenase n=1 Tax=Cytophaga aurantiaca TaxID=29530 RepID=UPI00036246DC|nr:2-hydroxyacid dehydrogenase [Cytophaga aurantiaca]